MWGVDGLTNNQELYCLARMRGLTQRAAYREAYPRSRAWKDTSVDCNAAKLEGNARVSQRMEGLRRQVARGAKLSRSRLLTRLDKLADASDAIVAERLESARKIDYNASQALISATKELLPFAEDDRATDSSFSADFGLLLAPAFLRPHRLIAARAQTDFWCGGGRGSMKSSWASLEMVNHLEQNPQAHAVVVMKYQNAIRDAAYAQATWALDALGLADEYDTPGSTLRMVKRATGQLIIFRGCDDASKIKSIKVPFGHVGIVWFEEADMFRGLAEIRKVNQSLTRGGAGCTRLYTYNPPRSKSCWINAHMDALAADGAETFRSTYRDAPAEWLGEAFISDAEELRRLDRPAYIHEYLGVPVGFGEDVFDRVVFREVTDEEIAAFDNVRCGQDFGWYPDPWAYTMSEWQPGKHSLVTFYEDGGNKLQPNEQAERIRDALTWTDEPGCEPTYHHLPILSDDAEPSDIASQRDTGVNARAASKGGMRMASYRFLQSCSWVIDPVRCPRLAKEVREMQYEQTKDGEWINAIPDGNDHWVDATRYALMREARSRAAYRATPQGQ